MSVKEFEIWTPVTNLPPYFGGYSIFDTNGSLIIRLHPGSYEDLELNEDLVIKFGRHFLAYRVHDEHVHPRFNTESSPPPSDLWKWGTHPCLIIHESNWRASFSDSQILYFQNVTHYFFYTLDRTIDVLALQEPDVSWEETAL